MSELVHRLRRHDKDDVWAERACDYLARTGLQGSPLRESEPMYWPSARP